MNQLTRVFNYEERQVRTIAKNGESWFVAKNVCDILDHSNSRMVVDRLDDDEKGVSIIYTPGGPQELQIINEPGLYSLILTSRKPEAKSFKRWITHEVIPAIRKTGKYETPNHAYQNETLQALMEIYHDSKGKLKVTDRAALIRAIGWTAKHTARQIKATKHPIENPSIPTIDDQLHLILESAVPWELVQSLKTAELKEIPLYDNNYYYIHGQAIERILGKVPGLRLKILRRIKENGGFLKHQRFSRLPNKPVMHTYVLPRNLKKGA